MSEKVKEKDPVKADFRNFLYLVWMFLGLPEPTPVQYDIAYNLQHGSKRLIIQAFRGVGKSWITSAYVLWLLYCNPQLKILVVSASKARADDFSTFTKRLIHEMPLLEILRARDGQRDSNIAFDVGPALPAHAPSVKSVGITGMITGSRADVIIADDSETPNNSLTQMMREKLSTSVKEFDAVLTPKPTSRIIFLGTPQTEMSVYNQLATRGYTLLIWPARYPNAEYLKNYGDRIAPFILEQLNKNPSLSTSGPNGVGSSVDPKRFPDYDLLEREASYGRSGFSMQFMLDTAGNDIDRFPLKLSDLMVLGLAGDMAPVKCVWGSGSEQVIDDLPIVGLAGDRYHSPAFLSRDTHGVIQYAAYQGTVMAIDPAGRGGDELSYAVVSMLNGYLFVRDCGGLVGGYSDDNLEKLARIAKLFKVNEVIVESNMGDGMFTKLLTPFLVRIYPVTTEEVRHSTQKERRIIDTLEPVMNQHRLIIDRALVEKDFKNYNNYANELAYKFQLFYQMTRLTKDRGSLSKDDRIDALAMAVARWVEVMDKDTVKVEKEHRDALLEAELEKFIEAALGGSSNSNNWMGDLM